MSWDQAGKKASKGRWWALCSVHVAKAVGIRPPSQGTEKAGSSCLVEQLAIKSS